MISTKKSYWTIFAEEVPSDLGIKMTDEQVIELADALEGAHENYGTATGEEVWNANWKAESDRQLIQKGMNEVFKYIQERVDTLNHGPARMFDFMSHEQRLAMHEIFEAKNFIGRAFRP